MNYRNKKLLEACRKLPCQICGIDDGTVCAAHSNQIIHGKGVSIKASDAMVAALCNVCHFAIDSGKTFGKDERKDFWNMAHQKTMRELIEREILIIKVK